MRWIAISNLFFRFDILLLFLMSHTIFSPFGRMFQVKSKLKGHQKRITGLAFSTNLNILVSSGADAHVSLLTVLL